MPLLFVIFQTGLLIASSHAVCLHTHVTQQSYLTGCSNHMISFPYGKTEKVELDSTFLGTENFPFHVIHAHAHELFCSVPFLSAENFL